MLPTSTHRACSILLMLSSWVALGLGSIQRQPVFRPAGPVFKVPIYAVHSDDPAQPITSYYGQISLGTPAQKFKIQFDTTIDYIWVPINSRDTKFPKLHHFNGYKCSKSISCVTRSGTGDAQETTLKFRDAHFEARMFKDKLSLNGLDEQIEDVHFAAITSSDKDLRKLPIDGFIGLSRQCKNEFAYNDGTLDAKKTFMDHLMHDKLKILKEARFAFWFHRQGNWGEVLFGGDDPARFAGFQLWHNVSSGGDDDDQTDQCGWFLGNLQPVAIGTTVVGCDTRNCHAKLDSGSNAITGPEEQVNRLYEILGATVDDSSQVAYVDCNRVESFQQLVFVMENTQYGIPAKRYIRKLGNKCYVAIFPNGYSGDQHLWTLGTVFMSHYYISFDLENKLIAINPSRL